MTPKSINMFYSILTYERTSIISSWIERQMLSIHPGMDVFQNSMKHFRNIKKTKTLFFSLKTSAFLHTANISNAIVSLVSSAR